tara:strand:- start:101 stop:454 length:354 start_codon:yes stop_codon:yes gene_type:complete
MGVIKIKGIKNYAFHGHLPEEAVLGGQFITNIQISLDSCVVEKTDELNDTIDYVHIIGIVDEQMKTKSKMIEHVARRIVDKILELEKVESVKVEVEKVQPPVNAVFSNITFVCEGKN